MVVAIPWRKPFAILLAALLCCSMFPGFAIADEVSGGPAVEEDASRLEAAATDGSSAGAVPFDEAVGAFAEKDADETSDSPAGTQEVAGAQPLMGDEGEGAAEISELGFVYIDELLLVQGAEQNIVFALSDESEILLDAVLRYEAPQGEQNCEATRIEGNAALFVVDGLEPGDYRPLSVEYRIEGDDGVFSEDLRGGSYSFTVQDFSEPLSGEVSVLALDDQGDMTTSETVQEAMEGAVDSSSDEAAAFSVPMARSSSAAGARTASSGVVVALDPGHGGSDSGAVANGLLEKDVNLKIAKYCQAALQRAGINVFMTRTTDVYVGLSERVEKAVAAKASVFVSLHINSATPAAEGCEVFVPNDSSYNHDAHVAGNILGQKVLKKLTELGLYNRGVKTKDSENGSKYPDGSTADYYSVINNARRNGIPGIIVEHAFITNAGDSTLLKSDAYLKKLGEADAAGIVEAINQGAIKGQGGIYNDGTWYRYKYSDGTDAKNIWVSSGGKWYYFGSDGYAVKWEQKIEGAWYYFNGQSQMQTGMVTWQADGLKSYYSSDGSRYSGWGKIGGVWYYFDPASGRSARYEKKIGDSWYYFDGQSRMKTGMVTWQADGLKSYYSSDGSRYSGWGKIGGVWYYFDPANGKSARYERKIGGSWYYFNGQSQMQTGMVTWQADGLKSYYNADGSRYSGWKKLGGVWYYFDAASGRSARWSKFIGGHWYYFDKSSQMQTGWITWQADGLRSFFDSEGRALVGWQTISGQRYFFRSDGKSARWLQEIGGNQYYFNGQSQQQMGWVTWVADGSKSYFDPANGGAMVTGQATIDGTLYDFGADGKIRNQIMGSPKTTVDAMVRDFNAQGKTYPSQVYAAKGARTINEFCQVLYDEAVAEGVRPAVLYAQVMLETGWLQFKGSSVKPEQCNFGGIGATDKDPKPATFPDVRTGLRAQVQHLKAYGSKEPLKNPCVDPRFHLVTRGVAPYVADLAGRWASDEEYGIKLNKLIDRVAG